jgi:hypothetical protein
VPTLKLRFYGRFFYAVACNVNGATTGTISVIAPRFDTDVTYPSGVEKFPRHLTRMSIRRDRVVLAPSGTDLPPDEKVLSDNPSVVQADTFVWHIDDRNISFQSDSGPKATLGFEDPLRKILDLPHLVEMTREPSEPPAALALDALSAGAGGRSQAVVTVKRGAGVARKVALDRVHLLTRADAMDGGPAADDRLLGERDPRTGQAQSVPTADLVEFTIPLQTQEVFTILIAKPGVATPNKVSVVPIESSTEVVVNFTHMCPDLPRDEDYDLEFGRYYNLLSRHPHDKAVVLRPVDEGGEIEECDKKASMKYIEGVGDAVLE